MIAQVLIITLLLTSTTNTYAGIGKVSEQTGLAEIVRNKQSSPSNVNSDIESMDTVITAKSKIGITFEDNTKVNITEHSKLLVDDFVYDTKKTTGKLALKIALGTVRYASGQIAKVNPQNVDIKTPTANIAVRGTDFSMTVDELGKSTIILLPSCDISGCITGMIEVSTDAGFVIMNQAYQTTIVSDKNSSPSKPVIIDIDQNNINNNLIVSPPIKTSNETIKIEQIKNALDVNFLDKDFLEYAQLDINALMIGSELDKNYLEANLIQNVWVESYDDLLMTGVMLPNYNPETNLKYYVNNIEKLILYKMTQQNAQLTIDSKSDAILNLKQDDVPLVQRINEGGTTKIIINQHK